MEWAVELFTRVWNTEELSIPKCMKAPYMRIVFLPEIFTKVYGVDQNSADNMILDMLDQLKVAMFVNPVQGRLCTRVSAQIFSTKAEYVYAAKMIKKKAEELEAKFS